MKLPLRSLLALIPFLQFLAAQAQVATGVSALPAPWEPKPTVSAPTSALPPSGGDPTPIYGIACDVQRDAVGSSSNAFTNILSEANVIAVNNDINSVVFIHRNNAGAFGGSSGHLRYDISTNGGTSWTSNQGPVNPLLTNAARYPSVAIYNPPGNTNPSLARMQYYAPYIIGSAFAGHVSGGRNLDGTANTEFYDQAAAAQPLIPRSLVNGAPGVMWAVDYVWTGTAYAGIRVLKGTWSGSDIVWAVNNTITPAYNTAYSGVPQMADIAINFDPTGMHGFVAALTHVTPGPSAYSFYPVFWETTDGGLTWGSAQQVDISQYDCVASLIGAGNYASTAFDIDLAVDANGEPHCFTALCNGNNAYAVYLGLAHHMFDITREHGMWNAVDISNVNAGRTTFGTAPNTVTYDYEPQVSRSDDGSKVFFTWVGSDASITLGGTNTTPNLWGAGYDVTTRSWSTVRNLTSCKPAAAGTAFFPKMAATTLNIPGGQELPVVTLTMTSSDPALAANFFYLDSLNFFDADFINLQCVASVTTSAPDTLVVCEGDSSLITSSGMDAYLWSNGDTDSSTYISTAGWVRCAARNGCCIGIDSFFVVIDDTVSAGYTYTPSGLLVDFFDASAGDPDAYAWNFGDGAVSPFANPSHVYAGPGTYVVCLTVNDGCGFSTVCDTLVITCAAAGFSSSVTGLDASFTDMSTGSGIFSYAWDFGDGGTSSSASPTHTYAAAGTYYACLTITDACGADTICDTVTIVCASADFSSSSSGLDASFTDMSGGAPISGWSWDFGDGGTSTLASPTHTYAVEGTYVVCLTITDACGTNTTCDTITIVCPAPGAGFTWADVGLGTVNFTNGSTGGTSYAWDFGDGSGTSTSASPSYTYSTTGTYFACLTVTDSCGSDTFCDSVSVIIINVSDPSLAGLQIWPNPADDQVTVSGSLLHDTDMALTLTTALGQRILATRVNASAGPFRRQLDLSTVAPGVYFLSVQTSTGKTVLKVVVQ